MAGIDKPTLDELLLLIGGDVDSLNELIQSFTDEAQVLSQELTKGLTDIELLSRTAHTLKSSSKDFGALKLSGLCSALERQAKSDSLVDAANQVTQIQHELECCVLELNQIKSGQLSV